SEFESYESKKKTDRHARITRSMIDSDAWQSPFEWKWTQFSFGEHIIKIKAYDLEGNCAGFDSLKVRKFL
ncbi:MAG: hypothetical protein R6U21_07390, partial [Thermoplasmatota archaeon]